MGVGFQGVSAFLASGATESTIIEAVPGIAVLPRQRGFWSYPVGNNATGGEVSGNYSPSVTGTGAKAFATTNLFTSTPQLGFTTATANTSYSRYVTGYPMVWRGNATGLGGFYVVIEFGVVTPQTDMFVWAGLINSGGSSSDPSTLTDLFGFGCDRGEYASMRLMHNDASGAATKTDLGASFPLNTSSVDFYAAEMWAEPNATSINYRITNQYSGATASGEATTNLPTSTTPLYVGLWMGPGNSAAAVSFSMFRVFGQIGYP